MEISYIIINMYVFFYALGNNCHVQCPNVRSDVGFVQWNNLIVHGIAMPMCFK